MTEPGVIPTFENSVKADNPTKKAENGFIERQEGNRKTNCQEKVAFREDKEINVKC